MTSVETAAPPKEPSLRHADIVSIEAGDDRAPVYLHIRTPEGELLRAAVIDVETFEAALDMVDDRMCAAIVLNTLAKEPRT